MLTELWNQMLSLKKHAVHSFSSYTVEFMWEYAFMGQTVYVAVLSTGHNSSN